MRFCRSAAGKGEESCFARLLFFAEFGYYPDAVETGLGVDAKEADQDYAGGYDAAAEDLDVPTTERGEDHAHQGDQCGRQSSGLNTGPQSSDQFRGL